MFYRRGAKSEYRSGPFQITELTLVYATDELLMDASAASNILAEAFRREMVYTAEDAVLNGTGTGQPLGILTASSTVSVAKEGSQAAATILYENIVKMMARLHPASWPNAVWLANISTLPQLVKLNVPIKNVAGTENVGSGGLLYDHVSQKLFGKPVIFIEQAKALGTVGDIMLVDLNEYLWIEKAMQFASSIHVNFLTDESAFRFTWRVDGQPAWKSTLTPSNGSDAVSPYVVLATRA
jgi:HK97 family phage major capsid protein